MHVTKLARLKNIKQDVKKELIKMSEENKEVVEQEEVEEKTKDEAEEKEIDTSTKDEKTFTQEELEDIVKQRLKRAEKQKEEAIKEAEKLAKMTADQKREYEFEKLQRENEELKKAQNKYELSREASNILSEKGIVANDDILNIVVKDDAEQTNKSVEAFSELITDLVEKQVKERLKGDAPKKATKTTKGITRDDINKMNYKERLKFKQENTDQYNSLMGK